MVLCCVCAFACWMNHLPALSTVCHKHLHTQYLVPLLSSRDPVIFQSQNPFYLCCWLKNGFSVIITANNFHHGSVQALYYWVMVDF